MLRFSPPDTTCRVRTFREGLLSGLGHDLELAVTVFAIEVDEGARTGTATFDAASLRVVRALRDGVELQATLYRPQGQREGLPCILSLTPYIAQIYHDRGMYFAAHGYVFASVDVRGRGNSGGEFTPLLQEANDGYDVIEWLAKQSYCNGKITMWGGSYGGYDQWATAKEKPPHLATIVPVAAVMPGLDFPMRGNIFYPYDMQWLTFVSGKAGQDKIFGDSSFWSAMFRRWYEAHAPFAELDTWIGNPSPIFQTWIAHPAALRNGIIPGSRR